MFGKATAYLRQICDIFSVWLQSFRRIRCVRPTNISARLIHTHVQLLQILLIHYTLITNDLRFKHPNHSVLVNTRAYIK